MALVIGLLPGMSMVAQAAEIIVDSGTTNWTTGNTYVVESNVSINNRINVTGTVTLVLRSGAKLTASKGIAVNEDNNLTIKGAGELEAATTEDNYAGIGGNSEKNCGTIVIDMEESGKINAQGGYYAAGIGGGFGGDGGTITINNGNIEASVIGDGAGIGGGWGGTGGKINISGGTVKAISKNGAGIGGGASHTSFGKGDGGEITITGGEVEAIGNRGSAGIGGGAAGGPSIKGGDGGTIIIKGAN